ncbi:hypothetical protein DRN63_00285 [Nanoarchaeota archaeon]|nr:MAG: hypothetical protein DRN63_00285 [Nanoarchaeota archaeon]
MEGMKEIYASIVILIIALIFFGFKDQITTGIARITGFTEWSDVTQASVTVNEFISATLFNVPIQFGNLNPGTTNQEATNNPLEVQVGGETNVNYNITLNGTSDFVNDTNTFSISNLEFNTTSLDWTSYELNVEKTAYANQPAPAGTPVNNSIWHRISVPAGQIAGTYTANITVTVKKA